MSGHTCNKFCTYAISFDLTDYNKANILVDSRGSARLADFGLAIIIDESAVGSTTGGRELRGTIRWMAPELLHPEEYGFSDDWQRRLPSTGTDIYALAMTILEVCISVGRLLKVERQ